MAAVKPLATLDRQISRQLHSYIQYIWMRHLSPGISYQLRDICSIYRYRLKVAKFKCKVHNEKIESSLFILNRPSLSIFRCMSMYETHRAVSVVSFIPNSMEQMRSTLSPNVELFSERTSCKQVIYVLLISNNKYS